MKFAFRLLTSAGIVGLTVLAAQVVPDNALGIGWLGASLFFALIVNRN